MNLVAASENKGVQWSNLNSALNGLFLVLHFQKNIQKINKLHFWVFLDSEMNLAPLLHRWKSKHISQKALLLNCRCQRLIYHTLSAFQNPVWHYYSKQKVSRICISQGCFIFPARSHLSKPPTQILHQHFVLLSERHPDAIVSVYGSLISHICDNISPRVGCRASLIRSRFYCCFSSSLAVTERSGPSLYRAKLCFFHDVDPDAGPFTSASRWDWGP